MGASVFPMGVTKYDPEKAWSGYTLMPVNGVGAVLIDMNGNVVRTWTDLQGFPNKLLPGGQVLGSLGRRENQYGYQDMSDLTQVDWDGNIVWSFNKKEQLKDGDKEYWLARQHHDYQREGNPVGYYVPGMECRIDGGNTLILCHEDKYKKNISDKRLLDDCFIEVDWEGNILWKWCVSDHFRELDFDETAKNVLFRNPNYHPNGGGQSDRMHIIPSNQPNAILALQILSPTIFLSGILGVYRGYFQAYRNMMPTSISQILEQIFNAAVSLIAAWMFIRYFADGSDGSVAKWGAAGSTVGTTAGVVIALLFMLMVYGVNRRAIRRRVDRDRVHKEESYGEILRLIILIVSPIILSSFIYNINGYLNGVLYSEIMGKHGVDADTISMLYAEYATYFMSIINIPLTLSSAAPTSMIPEVSALYATGDIDETRRRVDQTVQLSMFISIPCAVGLAVLAQPIVSLLFHGTNGVAGQLLMMGSFTILLNGMSNISNGVLQGIGKPKIPMITAAVALVVDVVVVVVLLMFTNLGIYALLVAMIVYAIVVCVLNDFFMKKYLDYKNPWKAAYVSPIVASAVMGVVAAGVYYGLHVLLPSNIICLGVAIILAAMAYFLVYILVDKTASERLSRMPGGAYLVRIAQKIRR